MKKKMPQRIDAHWMAVWMACFIFIFSLMGCGSSGGSDPAEETSSDSGGATFNTVGDYTLGGTAGQADAGVLAGGEYTLGGGFWRGGALAAPEGMELYLPLVLRDAG